MSKKRSKPDNRVTGRFSEPTNAKTRLKKIHDNTITDYPKTNATGTTEIARELKNREKRSGMTTWGKNR